MLSFKTILIVTAIIITFIVQGVNHTGADKVASTIASSITGGVIK